MRKYKNSSEEKPQKIKKEDLPIILADLPILQEMEQRKTWGELVTYIGYAPLCYGMYLILFGPNHLMVNISGPTFWQFIGLNPGAIVAIGVLIIMLGRWVKNSDYTKVRKYIDANYKLCDHFGHADETAKLVGTPAEDGKLVLRYRNMAPVKTPKEKQSYC